MTRARSIVMGVTLSVLSIGVSVLVMKFVAGHLYERPPYANGKRTVDYYIGKMWSSEGDAEESGRTSLMPHPYLLYANVPNLHGAGYINRRILWAIETKSSRFRRI